MNLLCDRSNSQDAEISSSHGGEYDVQSCLLMMEAVRTSETSVDNHFTRQYNPEDSSESQDAVCQNTLVNEKHVICLLTDYQPLPGPPLTFPRPILNPLRQKQACFFEITFLMDFACFCFFLVQKLNY
jgi:hypothetical protein